MAKLTKEEVNARLAPRGIEIVGEYKGTKSGVRARFRCLQGHEWATGATNVIHGGTGCPHCAGRVVDPAEIHAGLAARGIQLITEFKTLSAGGTFRCQYGHEWSTARIEQVTYGKTGCPHCAGRIVDAAEIHAGLAARGLMIIGGYKNSDTRARFRCQQGHEWESRVTNVVHNGTGCPHCAGRHIDPLTVYAGLAARGIHLIGEYRNCDESRAFVCRCGCSWETTVTNVIHGGTGCPECASAGIWSCATGYVYVMAYANGLTKIGISNAPETRRKELQRATREEITLIAAYQFADGTGRAAWKVEQLAHGHFADRHARLTGFDGSTELFRITPAEACDYLRQAGGRVVQLEEAQSA